MVVNTRSRRGARFFAASRHALSTAELEPVAIHGARNLSELRSALTSCVAHRPDVVVVGGGDGTMSEAVRHLARQDPVLGVLPLGTTNNFARNLGIPMDLDGAVAVLGQGRVAAVDVGRVGDRLFANMVSLGLSCEVAARVPAGLKRLVGRAAYPMTALVRLPAHRPFRARLMVNGSIFQICTHQLNIANGNFHAGMPISRDGTASDELLLVYPMGGSSRAGLIVATAQHTLRGRYRPMAGAPFLVTDSLWLETDPVLAIDVDGEIVGRTPTRVALAPGALRVIVGGIG